MHGKSNISQVSNNKTNTVLLCINNKMKKVEELFFGMDLLIKRMDLRLSKTSDGLDKETAIMCVDLDALAVCSIIEIKTHY